jgi:preprotein translocase, SecE subunit, bacterial
MGEVAKKEKAPKKSWFKGLKSELKKIVWPDKKTLGKQTVAVITVSIALCALISIIDAVITFGVNFLV